MSSALRPVLLALGLATIAVVSLGCESTYLRVTAASNLGVNVTGNWRGTFLVGHCPNPFSCGLSSVLGLSGARLELHLSLQDDKGRVSGSLRSSSWNREPATLSGHISDGVLYLTGRGVWRDLGICRYAGDLELHDLQLRADVGGRVLSGDLTFNGHQRLTGCAGSPVRVIGSELHLVAE